MTVPARPDPSVVNRPAVLGPKETQSLFAGSRTQGPARKIAVSFPESQPANSGFPSFGSRRQGLLPEGDDDGAASGDRGVGDSLGSKEHALAPTAVKSRARTSACARCVMLAYLSVEGRVIEREPPDSGRM